MALPTYTQDPNDRLDYTMDWSAEMTALADTIDQSEWFPPVGLTATGDFFTDTAATVFLSGGVVGETYIVSNRITTVGGRVIERSIKLKLKAYSPSMNTLARSLLRF